MLNLVLRFTNVRSIIIKHTRYHTIGLKKNPMLLTSNHSMIKQFKTRKLTTNITNALTIIKEKVIICNEPNGKNINNYLDMKGDKFVINKYEPSNFGDYNKYCIDMYVNGERCAKSEYRVSDIGQLRRHKP